MRAHTKSVGDGLEMFLLLVNTVAAPPPPGLMHERTVRRIHQPDDSVIDAHRHVGGEVSELVLSTGDFTERLDLRRWFRSLFRFRETRALRARLRDVNPDKTI